MTLKEQMEADLEVFFNPDEFGQTVTYDNGTDPAADILAVVDFDREGRYHADYALIYLKASDVERPKYRDKITIDGRVWRVMRDEKDGLNVWLINRVWSVNITADERFTGWGG